jgi:Domain of unknown function (DUF4214)
MTPEQTLLTTSKSGSPGAGTPAVAARKLLHLEDFSCLANVPFIEAAYWAALKRGPDPEGKEVYLRLLENGTTKAEILAYLIDSPEGRLIGAEILGLAGACWRARILRYPGVGTLLRLGGSLWPFTQDHRDIKAAFQRLAHIEDQAETRARMADQAYRNVTNGIEALRIEFRNAQPFLASTDSVVSLQGDLNALGIALEELEKSKLNRSEVDLLSVVSADLHAELKEVHASLRTTIYRGLDDLNRTTRRLLDGKAEATAIPALEAVIERRWNARFEELTHLFEAFAARRIDSAEIESVKKDLHASLEAALGGLTQSITAVGASRVDRQTIETLLAEASKVAEASKAVVEQLHEEIRELNSSLQRERQTGRET